jgi:hypothetical protein
MISLIIRKRAIMFLYIGILLIFNSGCDTDINRYKKLDTFLSYRDNVDRIVILDKRKTPPESIDVDSKKITAIMDSMRLKNVEVLEREKANEMVCGRIIFIKNNKEVEILIVKKDIKIIDATFFTYEYNYMDFKPNKDIILDILEDYYRQKDKKKDEPLSDPGS